MTTKRTGIEIPASSPSKIAKAEEDHECVKIKEETDNETLEQQRREEMRMNSEKFLSIIINEGSTVKAIYDQFMEAILEDPIMLDVYQQVDMVNVVFAARPDFPFPNILWLVKKRYEETLSRIKQLLTVLNTFFIVHFTTAMSNGQRFLIVEVSYLCDGIRRSIILTCIPLLNGFPVHPNVIDTFNSLNIKDRCYHVCGVSDDLNYVSSTINSQLKAHHDLPEYLSKYGKLKEDELEEFHSLLHSVLELIKNLETEHEQKLEILQSINNSIINSINEIINELELDLQQLELRIRAIEKEPDELRYYSTSNCSLDLLCVQELRKLRSDIKLLMANLNIVLETNVSIDEINKEYQKGSTTSVVHWRKVVENCITVYERDFIFLKLWAVEKTKQNLSTKTIQQFEQFVQRLTPRTETGLWIQVFLTKQWLRLFPKEETNGKEGVNKQRSASMEDVV